MRGLRPHAEGSHVADAVIEAHVRAHSEEHPYRMVGTIKEARMEWYHRRITKGTLRGVLCGMMMVWSLWGLAAAASAATYHVAPTGNDTQHSCSDAQQVDTPKRTIRAGAKCLAPGDTLLIRAGTYRQPLQNIDFQFTGSNPPNQFPSGRGPTDRTVIRGYHDERPVIAPINMRPKHGILHGDNTKYVTFQQLEIEMKDCPSCIGVGGHNMTHITVKDVVFRNYTRRATVQGSGGCVICVYKVDNVGWVIEDNVMTGIQISGTYSRLIHGIYNHGAKAIIRRNVIDMNRTGGFGLHLFDSRDSGNIEDVLIEGNRITGAGCAGILTGGRNNRVINNELYDNGHNCIQAKAHGGIVMLKTATGSEVLHNTVYKNHRECVYNRGTRDLTVRNNLCVANTSNVVTGGPGTKSPNALTTTNPFRDAPKNFQLTEPRKSSVSVGVSKDRRGIPRESPPDHGAHEFVQPGYPRNAGQLDVGHVR